MHCKTFELPLMLSPFLVDNDFREQELFRGCREVQELNLSRNSLTQIPDKGFQLLTKLVKLDLSNNMLNDPTFGAEYVSIDVRAKCLL